MQLRSGRIVGEIKKEEQHVITKKVKFHEDVKENNLNEENTESQLTLKLKEQIDKILSIMKENEVNIPQCKHPTCLHEQYADTVRKMQTYRSMKMDKYLLTKEMLIALNRHLNDIHCLAIKTDFVMQNCKILLDNQMIDSHCFQKFVTAVEEKVNDLKRIDAKRSYLTEKQNNIFNDFLEISGKR